MATLAEARLSDAERRAVDHFVELLTERFGEGLSSVWLYGSRARGEDTGAESDIDLLVVTAGGFKRDREAVYEVADEAATAEGISPVHFSIVIWTPARVEDRRRIDSFFAREVDRDKIVLHGRP